MIAAIKWSG